MVKKVKQNVEAGMFNTNQVCTRCNFSRSSLRNMLRTGAFPKHTRVVGRKGKRWPIELVEDWRLGGGTLPRGRPRSGE